MKNYGHTFVIGTLKGRLLRGNRRGASWRSRAARGRGISVYLSVYFSSREAGGDVHGADAKMGTRLFCAGSSTV